MKRLDLGEMLRAVRWVARGGNIGSLRCCETEFEGRNLVVRAPSVSW